MTKRVAVVGAGCSGVLVCNELSEHCKSAGISEIVLYEGSGRFGPGLPYGEDSTDDVFILNMAAALLGVDTSEPDGFLQWLIEQAHLPSVSANDYVPRRKMGEYLSAQLQVAAQRMKAQGMSLRMMASEVVNLERAPGGYRVHTSDGSEIFFNVVLAVGHLRKRTPFPNSDRYFANPYHELRQMRARIGPGARVGILGTKLTAIDMSILMDSIEVGEIHIYSNSGRLPLVRGVIPTAPPSIEHGKLPPDSIAGFLRWFRRLHTYESEYKGFLGHLDPASRLNHEIQAASRVRDWQLWLDATKTHIDRYWQQLDSNQKRRFYRKYQGLWMSYRHPMPIENARKIKAMLQKGNLSIHGGYKATRLGRDGTIFVDVKDGTLTLDYAIDATGFSGNLARLDAPLIERLLDQALIKQCPHGGIAVDPTTFMVDGESGLYALGPLTQGSLFYVSAIERLSLHAKTIASHLATHTPPGVIGASTTHSSAYADQKHLVDSATQPAQIQRSAQGHELLSPVAFTLPE